MIVDRPISHFIFVLPFDHVHGRYNYIAFNGRPLTNKQYLESWGKWLVFGGRPYLDELAQKLDPHVEAREIAGVKYDRRRIEEFQLDCCVMCVYCHFEVRDRVWGILASHGVRDKAWMFERETLEKWLPGGVNLEKWITGRNLDAVQAELVRKDAERTFQDLFGNEDAIFTGIEQ